jgi:antitoxin (DNA-binding transcriptional repressor) of toxin-antitoxin stability system
MHFITFGQLRIARCLDQLEAWLRAGETVELLRHKRVVAHFVPAIPRPFTEEEEALYAEKKRDRQRKKKPTPP